MIIGITGTLGAGKGTIVEFLKEKGFIHHSVREFITREIIKRGLEINRNNMVIVANEMRTAHSPGYIAECLYLEAQQHGKDAVIESLRTPGEIETLRKKGNFTLLAVDANLEKRYHRITARKTATDMISFEEFQQNEAREMNSTDPNKQNLKKCIEMADHTFKNNGTFEDLKREVEKFLGGNKMSDRPSWDEYFLNISREVAKRATCLRGKIGVVLVRNKRIISTGYNGSPKGLPHCNEVGCKVWKTIDETGKEEERCLRTVHGELNAIAQAALHGVSTEGATAYGTYKPCSTCMKALINAGIKRVVCEKDYHDNFTDEIAREAGVEIVIVNPHQSSLDTVENAPGYNSQ